MILSPIGPDQIEATLARYRAALPGDGASAAVFDRVAASRSASCDVTARHRDAVALAARFGMNPIDEEPRRAFSWDGRQVRARSESAVLIHEVAHFQLAAPSRRFLPDFGLGAGPETGRVAEADRARCVGDQPREIEEQMASLLGVLWEIELGQPGILAFKEQNWLEGAGRSSTAAFFASTLARLIRLGLADDTGRPIYALRATPDA
jgi:hypothetical protein